MQENIIAAIPQGRTDTVLEVALIQGDSDNLGIELRCLAWGPGVGWYRQHTLKLDRTAARALLRAFGSVRSRLHKEPCAGPAKKVIPLPDTGRAQSAIRQQTLPG
jgi:hypothetical protein